MTKHERYNRSPKGRARYARYRASDKGHANERRVHLRYAMGRRAERIHELEKELSHSQVRT